LTPQDEVDAGEHANPANWHGGWVGIYYSKRDSRAFVPKRCAGMGITINFARLPGVLFLVGILAFAGVIIVLSRGTPR
jgi:uncharacterized membrane protein